MNIEDIPADPKVIEQEMIQYSEQLLSKSYQHLNDGNLEKAFICCDRLVLMNINLEENHYIGKDRILELATAVLSKIKSWIQSADPDTDKRLLNRFRRWHVTNSINLDLIKEGKLPHNSVYEIERRLKPSLAALSEVDQMEIGWLLSFQKIVYTFFSNPQDFSEIASTTNEFLMDLVTYVNSNPVVSDQRTFAGMCAAIGSASLDMGQVQTAIVLGSYALSLTKQTHDEFNLRLSLLTLGNANRHLGKLDRALEYYKQSLDIKGIPSVYYAHPLRFVGYIYQTRGRIDIALKYYQASLNLFKVHAVATTRETAMSKSLIRIGYIYHIRGTYKKALEYYFESLQTLKSYEHDAPRNIVINLFYIILTCLEVNDEEATTKYYEEMAEYQSQFKHMTPVIDHLYRLTSALIMKKSSRWKQKAEAQSLLEEIVYGTVYNYEYTIIAIPNFVDMLIDEMGEKLDQEIFDEINKVLEKLLDIAEQQQLHYININTIILKSRLESAQDNYESARSLLQTGMILCDKIGAQGLREKVLGEQQLVINEIERMKDVVEKNPALIEEINQKNFQDFMERAKMMLDREFK